MNVADAYRRHEHEGRLLFVQVDHLSGELLGDALGRLWAAGATNVQLLPTLAKKGRPGQLLLIDVRPGGLAAIEEVLLAELGVHGWHAVKTEHVHVETEMVEREIDVKTRSTVIHARLVGKRRKNGREIMIEHDACSALKEKVLAEAGLRIPLRELVSLAKVALNQPGRGCIDLSDREAAE